MDEHRESNDVTGNQVRSSRSVTRRHLLKLSAAGALGVGAANLLGASAASAARETVFAAPRLQASTITFLVCGSTFSFWQTSKPESLGIMMSSRIKSG